MRTTKTCSKCKTEKLIAEFGILASTGRVHTYCKPCKAVISRENTERKSTTIGKKKDSDALLIHGHKNMMLLETALRGIHE